MDLSKQYNNFAQKFAALHDITTNNNRKNRETFYGFIDFIKPGDKLLDLACGDGQDLAYYKSLGADVYGLDASEELVTIAKRNHPDIDIKVGAFENIPFEASSFDIVLSKYAIQTSEDLKPVFSEIHRVLKPGGVMMYLVTHPFRQYFEKKDGQADYFKQSIVDSNIFDNSILIKEASHTIGRVFKQLPVCKL